MSSRGRTKERTNIQRKPIKFGISIDLVDPEHDELYHRDIYLPEDFPDMALFPGLDDDKTEFIKKISDSTLVSETGFVRFLAKFGILYMQSEFVRQHTDGWTFLFYEEDYIGAFSTENKACSYASRFPKAYFIINMYPKILYEYHEQINTFSYRQTEMVDVGDRKIPTYAHTYF